MHDDFVGLLVTAGIMMAGLLAISTYAYLAIVPLIGMLLIIALTEKFAQQ